MFTVLRLWWQLLCIVRAGLKASEDPEQLARFDRGELPYKPGDTLDSRVKSSEVV